jgi:hypothetical protein
MPRQCSPASLALDGNDAMARRSTPPIRRLHCSMKSESGRTGICQGESSSDHTRLGTKDAPSLLDAAGDDPSIPPTEARDGTSHFPARRIRPFSCSFDGNRPKQRRTEPSAAHPFPSCRTRNPLFRSNNCSGWNRPPPPSIGDSWNQIRFSSLPLDVVDSSNDFQVSIKVAMKSENKAVKYCDLVRSLRMNQLSATFPFR